MRRVVAGTVIALVQGDITTIAADAVVNAANAALAGGGGVDGAIHRAGGPTIQEECSAFPWVRPGVRCPTGEVRTTSAGQMAARYVIHAVGPVFDSREPRASEDALASAYAAALAEAVRLECRSVVMPALSTGAFRFPIRPAASVAVRAVVQFVRASPGAIEAVTFSLFSERDLRAFSDELANA